MKANGTRAALVPAGAKDAPGYRMFEPRELTAEGVFLAGTLLLEPGEEFTIELSFADASSLRVRARVTRLDRGSDPGMAVAFTGLSDSDRQTLKTKLEASHG